MAHYFVGTVEPEGLVYLDPHFVQNKSKDEKFYHYDRARVIEIREMDPAISFGYLLSS
jgi:hypothetical protein